jgi:hypothetical protein
MEWLDDWRSRSSASAQFFLVIALLSQSPSRAVK